MIDYLEVKRFYAKKLAEDAEGTGRVESAFFHTMKMVYLQGVTDGQNSLVQSDPLEKIVGIIDGKGSREVNTQCVDLHRTPPAIS